MMILGTACTPIAKDHEFGINIEDVVQIVVDTETQMVTEEINHVPVASQPLKRWTTWLWNCLLCCYRPTFQEQPESIVPLTRVEASSNHDLKN